MEENTKNIAGEIFADIMPRIKSLTILETEEVFNHILSVIKSHIKTEMCIPKVVKTYRD